MIRPVHPFPARMAPELAIGELTSLKPNSIVLDQACLGIGIACPGLRHGSFSRPNG